VLSSRAAFEPAQPMAMQWPGIGKVWNVPGIVISSKGRPETGYRVEPLFLENDSLMRMNGDHGLLCEVRFRMEECRNNRTRGLSSLQGGVAILPTTCPCYPQQGHKSSPSYLLIRPPESQKSLHTRAPPQAKDHQAHQGGSQASQASR
jgi:hypothetical protein